MRWHHKKTKCPGCGKTVYILNIDGEQWGYYERERKTHPDHDPKGKIARHLSKSIGVPCYYRGTHTCKTIKKLQRVNL